jgi:hypothetical protein
MGSEIERFFSEAEDFLRRNLPSRSQREAKKRRAQRKLEEFGRRARRAGLLFGLILAALVVASILLGGIGFLTWLVAIPTALLFACLSLSWPSGNARRMAAAAAAPAVPGAPQALPLDELARRAEEGLMDRCSELPGRALPAADRIVARLADLQPCLAALPPDSLLAGEARRLIGTHLPKLVDSYLELPPPDRAPASESSQRLIESLGIVADELGDLLQQASREKHLSFETHRRFIETRYKDDDALRGE